MKVDRFVCDNHEDRTAVATYVVAQLRVGERGALDQYDADAPHVDLCGECAAVLGWESPIPTEDDVRASDAQRRLIFATCRELGIDDDDRHAITARVTGDASTRNLLARQVDALLVALHEYSEGSARTDARG